MEDRKFLYIDDEPLLMRARWFSFGFTQVEDEPSTGGSVLVQHYPNEIRLCLSFDKQAQWESFRVEQLSISARNAESYDSFLAYPKQLKLEKIESLI